MYHMQFLLLVLTLLIPLNLSERVQRVRSVTCGSSLKSVKDPFCQLKSSRQDTLVTLSMTLLRKISDGVISYKVDRVSTYELKTLLDLKDVQICSFIESGKFLSSVPIVGESVRSSNSENNEKVKIFNLIGFHHFLILKRSVLSEQSYCREL
jgi:hypothetical protein